MPARPGICFLLALFAMTCARAVRPVVPLGVTLGPISVDQARDCPGPGGSRAIWQVAMNWPDASAVVSLRDSRRADASQQLLTWRLADGFVEPVPGPEIHPVSLAAWENQIAWVSYDPELRTAMLVTRVGGTDAVLRSELPFDGLGVTIGPSGIFYSAGGKVWRHQSIGQDVVVASGAHPAIDPLGRSLAFLSVDQRSIHVAAVETDGLGTISTIPLPGTASGNHGPFIAWNQDESISAQILPSSNVRDPVRAMSDSPCLRVVRIDGDRIETIARCGSIRTILDRSPHCPEWPG